MQQNKGQTIGKHPSRHELIAAASHMPEGLEGHLAACAECRELFYLLAAFRVAGELPLPDAPANWVARAKEIAETTNPLLTIRGLAAKLSFDSWKMPLAAGVRSRETAFDRRVRFEAGTLTVDIRAEHQASGWEFTAQVWCDKGNPAAVTLLADRQVVPPDASGFYQWSSARPPRVIRLQADETTIDLPELSWKETPQ